MYIPRPPNLGTIISTSASAGLSDAITAIGALSFVASRVPDWGDLVDFEDDYEVEESAEPIEWYFFSGLYYLICIEQGLAQNYRIKLKLGTSPLSGWPMTSER